MAFERLGIGGVLTFDSQRATTNMKQASRGFKMLQSQAARLRTAMASVRTGLSQFTLAGGLFAGVATMGIGALLHDTVKFGEEMETTGLGIATILSTAEGIPLQESLTRSRDIMQQLADTAARSPVGVQDLGAIFTQIVGPMRKAGGEMNTIMDLTKSGAIFAQQMGMNFNDMGMSIFRMLAGQAEIDNRLVATLRSTGLMTEETKEWKKMLPEKRMERILEMMSKFGEAGDEAGKTWAGLTSTFKDLRRMISLAFLEPAIEWFKVMLGDINTRIQANFEGTKAIAKEWGERLVPFMEKAVQRIKEFAGGFRSMFRVFGRVRTQITNFLDRIGFSLSEGIGTKIAEIAGKVAAVFVAVGPLLPIIAMVASKVGAILSILGGIASILAGPIGIALAAAAGVVYTLHRRGVRFRDVMNRIRLIILRMRPDMDRVKDALHRWWTVLRRVWGVIRDNLIPSMKWFLPFGDALAVAWDTIRGEVTKTWVAISQVVEEIWNAVEPIAVHWLPIMKMVAILMGVTIMGTLKAITVAIRIAGAMLRSWIGIVTGIVKFLRSDIPTALNQLSLGFRRMGMVILRAIAGPLQGVSVILGGLITQIAAAARAVGLTPVATALESANKVIAGIPSYISALGSTLTGPATIGAEEVAEVRGAGRETTRAARVARAAAEGRSRAAGRQAPPPPEAEQPCIELNQRTEMRVDGRGMSAAMARHRTEISERAGFSSTPWQRRRISTSSVESPRATR